MNGTQLVTTASSSYTHWLAHMHRNLRLLGLADNLTVCATDAKMLEFATAHGMRAQAAFVQGAVSQMGAGAKFNSKMWYKLVHQKQHCVWGMLETAPDNSTILLLDSDITLFRDPLPYLHDSMSSGSDIAFMDDRGMSDQPFLNTGFFLMRSNEATRELGRVYTRELLRNRSRNDQSVLNDLLVRHGSELRVRTQVIDPRVVHNGRRFYETRHRRPINVSTIVGVHHNWIKGDDNKWARAVAYETILQYDNETLRHFQRRARRAMLLMPAWVYHRPLRRQRNQSAPAQRQQTARGSKRRQRLWRSNITVTGSGFIKGTSLRFTSDNGGVSASPSWLSLWR
jgi:hypothetical protein